MRASNRFAIRFTRTVYLADDPAVGGHAHVFRELAADSRITITRLSENATSRVRTRPSPPREFIVLLDHDDSRRSMRSSRWCVT